MSQDQRARVQALREQGWRPKQIAREVGLSVAEVGELLFVTAADPTYPACWVSHNWSIGLGIEGHPDWPRSPRDAQGGLVGVLIARRHRYDKVALAGYLVDVYCLGVKNALVPRILEGHEAAGFQEYFFGAYDAPPFQAPLDLGAQLVHGGVAYARTLGFEPHPDFAAVVEHLGPAEGSDITFGQDGKPFYQQGPYDDTRTILRSLSRASEP